MRAYATVPKNASETALSPTGHAVVRRAMPRAPPPTRSPSTAVHGRAKTTCCRRPGGPRRADAILKPDDGHTRSERRCLVTHTGQFGYVRGRGRRRVDTALPHRFASIDHDLGT